MIKEALEYIVGLKTPAINEIGGNILPCLMFFRNIRKKKGQ